MPTLSKILTKWMAGLPRAAKFGLLAIVLATSTYALTDLRWTRSPRLPDFTLQQVLSPQLEVSVDSLTSRPAIVNVWASWCVACRVEHDFLMELGKNEGLHLIGLNYQDNREDAKRWLTYFGDPYRFSIYDEDGAVGKAMQVEVLPVTLLIGEQNEILARHVGPLAADTFARKFESVLEAARENGK